MTATDSVMELLARWPEEEEARTRVMPLVYRDLRAIAASLFAHERRDHTLPPTALVNEAYIRLQNGGPWKSRAHFFGSAARAMRQVLVDYARRHKSRKRGGDLERIPWDDLVACEPSESREILAVDQALCLLEILKPRWFRIVQLRYFTGLSVEEVAETLDISPSTVKEDWARAKTWLREHFENL